MTEEHCLQLAATLLGPLLAAEATKASPIEAAKRLFEFADAIKTQAKLKPAARSTVVPLRI